MTKIAIATANQHKMAEIVKIMAHVPVELVSLADFPEIDDIEETGTTFEENALIKAKTLHAHCGLLTLADDSGIEVDALDGAPGVYSARYAGLDKSSEANNSKLLDALRDVPDDQRGAQFRCVVAIVSDNLEEIVEGTVRGHILHALQGTGGFGYDPLFTPEGFDQSYAQISPKLKNQMSHRGIAFRQAADVLARHFQAD